jgi:predicted phosphodiesterase
MRTALISDIHGNRQALDRVLDDLARRNVDSIVCLGDVATLGPSPRYVLERVRQLECPCIIGNHEQALFSPENCEQFQIVGAHLSGAIYWCIEQLDKDDFDFMRTFKANLTHDLGGGRELFAYHASPKSTIDGIYPTASLDRLREEFGELGSSVAVVTGGHTHEQMLVQFRDRLVVNPGSVGLAFRTPFEKKGPPSILPVSEYAFLESTAGGISVEFQRLTYDIAGFVADVLATENPLNGWWIEEFERLGIMDEK